jgi:hypothetical protein
MRDCFRRIFVIRWPSVNDCRAKPPIYALILGPKREKAPKSGLFKNEGIPEVQLLLVIARVQILDRNRRRALAFRSLTAAPPPFSAMNSTPADSRGGADGNRGGRLMP